MAALRCFDRCMWKAASRLKPLLQILRLEPQQLVVTSPLRLTRASHPHIPQPQRHVDLERA